MEQTDYRRRDHKSTNRRVRLDPEMWEWIDRLQAEGGHHTLSSTIDYLLKTHSQFKPSEVGHGQTWRKPAEHSPSWLPKSDRR